MTPMNATTPPIRRRKRWRLNTSVQSAFPNHRFYDLFVDDKYQSVWIREDTTTGKFDLGKPGIASYIGTFDSMQEAEDHLVVLDVIRRFERAYE